VVGGSADEFYTEGAYVSGDLDLCLISPVQLDPRTRQELIGRLGAIGGPRSWQVGDAFVDILGSFQNLARTPNRRLQGPLGEIQICPVEELIAERVLVSFCPGPDLVARECAEKLVAAALQGEIETNWVEVRRLTEGPAYQNWADVKALVHEKAETLKIRGPYDPHG
jgi:hypothetical protein